MKTLFAVLFTVALLPASAQTTWNGLKFGMTPKEVSAILKAKKIIVEEPKNQGAAAVQFAHVVVGEFWLGGPYTGEASLLFPIPDRRLKEITLYFRSSEDHGCFQVPPTEITPRILMAEQLSEKLVERYGKPTMETGTVPTHDQLVDYYISKPPVKIEAERLWKIEGQIIKEELSISCGTVLLRVSYTPEEKSGF